MLDERRVRVSADPVVDLFVAGTAGTSGRTLLVVHGGPDWDHTYLREPLVELGGTHRLLMPDLRGCGRSSWGLADDQYSWDLVVTDLLALLDDQGVETADVLGFSTGGLIAQRLTLAAPNRVRRLIVASSSVAPVPPHAFGDWDERSKRQATVAQQQPDPATMSGPSLTRAWARAAAPMDLWHTGLLPSYLRRLEDVHFSGEWAPLWLRGMLPSARPEDATRRLRDLAVPMLLLHGRRDMTFPAFLAVEAAAAIPTAQAVILDDAGHMAHVDQPDAWLSAVATFLR